MFITDLTLRGAVFFSLKININNFKTKNNKMRFKYAPITVLNMHFGSECHFCRKKTTIKPTIQP